MRRAVGIPEREGTISRMTSLMNLPIRTEVTPIDVTVDRRTELRSVERRIEGRP